MNTTSKNETNVEAAHSSNQTPRHLSDPMKVEGRVECYKIVRGDRSTALFFKVGRVAIFRGKDGSWGPHLKTGQVIVVDNTLERFTARVERFLEAPARKTSRYYRGPVKPIACSYVVVVMKIEDLAP